MPGIMMVRRETENTMNVEPRIVVGVDGSPASVAALRWALTEAERMGVEVEAVTAWHSEPPPVSGPMLVGLPYRDADLVMSEQQEQLTSAVAQTAGTAPGVVLRQKLVAGWPPRELVGCAQGATLLVVGRQGHSWLGEKVLGTVSAYCIRHAQCPVVVMPIQGAVTPEDKNETTARETPTPAGKP
jgi:nucleotide-binding universal stress UspA family protein